MGHKGRQGLTRKALPGRARAKTLAKFTSSNNVDKVMKKRAPRVHAAQFRFLSRGAPPPPPVDPRALPPPRSIKATQHQPLRSERPARAVDVEKRRRLQREPSPEEPRPDGRFEFTHPPRRGRTLTRR